MSLTFRAALSVLAMTLAPLSVSAQDDGRAYDVQLADQIDTACGGSDLASCSALIAAIPANSPLQERALTAAINSGMTETQVAQIAGSARITPLQAARVQGAAVQRGYVSAALTVALQTATTGGQTVPVDNDTPPSNIDNAPFGTDNDEVEASPT